MGMYSRFVKQQINVVNHEGLQAMRLLAKHESKFDNLSVEELISEDYETVDFGAWDGWKIEGYWYDDMVVLLRQLAKFIEGYVEFQYESEYKYRLVFKEQKVFFQKEKEVIFEDMEELKNDRD